MNAPGACALPECYERKRADHASRLDRPAALDAYDRIVVAISGGKDSVACILALVDAGAPRNRIILIHHEVDGREGSTLMDWPSTKPYVEALSAYLEIPVIWSWRVGGIEG